MKYRLLLCGLCLAACTASAQTVFVWGQNYHDLNPERDQTSMVAGASAVLATISDGVGPMTFGGVTALVLRVIRMEDAHTNYVVYADRTNSPGLVHWSIPPLTAQRYRFVGTAYGATETNDIVDRWVTATNTPVGSGGSTSLTITNVQDLDWQPVWTIDANGDMRPATTDRDLLPLTHFGGDIGSSTQRWRVIYASNLVADSISGSIEALDTGAVHKVDAEYTNAVALASSALQVETNYSAGDVLPAVDAFAAVNFNPTQVVAAANAGPLVTNIPVASSSPVFQVPVNVGLQTRPDPRVEYSEVVVAPTNADAAYTVSSVTMTSRPLLSLRGGVTNNNTTSPKPVVLLSEWRDSGASSQSNKASAFQWAYPLDGANDVVWGASLYHLPNGIRPLGGTFAVQDHPDARGSEQADYMMWLAEAGGEAYFGLTFVPAGSDTHSHRLWVSGSYAWWNVGNGDMDFRIDGTADYAYQYDAGLNRHGWGGQGVPAVPFHFTNGTARFDGPSTGAALIVNGHMRLLSKTTPPTASVDGPTLYATNGELQVIDSSGNYTLLSPHPDGDGWWFVSENEFTGKRVEIDMETLAKEVQRLSGKPIMTVTSTPPRRTWRQRELELVQAAQAERAEWDRRKSEAEDAMLRGDLSARDIPPLRDRPPVYVPKPEPAWITAATNRAQRAQPGKD
jgi:hypothetical protein